MVAGMGWNDRRMLPCTNDDLPVFGLFELDTESEQLLKTGHTVRIQQQPYKLLCLLISLQAGKVVTRDDIRGAALAGRNLRRLRPGRELSR